MSESDTQYEPRLEKVRRRAYELWKRDGEAHGRHEDHWREAERQIEAEAQFVAEDSASSAKKSVSTPTPPD